jgi:hypothetical protein
MKLTKEQALEILLNAHSLSDDVEVWLVDDSSQTEDTITFVTPDLEVDKAMNLNNFSVDADGNLEYQGSTYNTTFQVLAVVNLMKS